MKASEIDNSFEIIETPFTSLNKILGGGIPTKKIIMFLMDKFVN